MKKFLFLILSIIALQAISQSPLGRANSANQLAFEYFQAQQYHDVIKLISNKESLSTDEKIIYELSRLKTGENASDEIKYWIQNHKKHPLQSLARFKYAEHSFYQGDSAVSKNLLKSIRPTELSTADQASYGFVYGILQLQSGNYKNAASLFNHAKKNGYDDHLQLAYYQAFTSYHLNDLNSTLTGFQESVQSSEYALSSKFFIAKIQLESGNYDEVIALSQSEISDEKSITNSGFHQLIGEAYALTGNEAKADAYFEQAINKHPDRPSSALFYQAGVSKFRLGNVDKALVFLKEAGIGAGPYAKLSAFQLGRLYIKRNELENALTAYIEASSSEDDVIKEESLYQAAKLNAKLERYTDAINFSDDYLKNYPTGTWNSEIQDLIAQSYLKTSNYDLAINHLEKIGVVNEIQRSVYQKVTFSKAILLFNDGDFNNSTGFFEKSLDYQEDRLLASDAHFYLGEILLRKEAYPQAIISYQKQSPITPESHYGIGYAYYNQQEYRKGINHFQEATKSNQSQVELDARLRLADCYYATKSYDLALASYNDLPENDYIIFQKGIVLKSLGREEDAIEVLNKVSTLSGLRDNADYNVAQTYFEQANFNEAEKGFSKLINSYPKSGFIPKAYLNRAISNRNLQRYDQAKNDYEYVIDQFIQREEAFNAILGLQELQQRGVKVGNLDKYISAYKKANPDDSSLEVVEFEEAKSSYFALDYSSAIPKLNDFLSEYTQSKFKGESEYYLGDSYYRTEQYEEAKKVFDQQKYVRNVFTGRILNRLGTINTLLETYEESIEAYQLLNDLNLSPKDNCNAISGLMISYYRAGDLNNAIVHANQVMNLEWKPLNADQKASFLKAKSLEALAKYEEAVAEYAKLAKGTDAIAVESSYRLAFIRYNQLNYDQSLDLLFDLNAKFGSYTEWVDQSYLLIAENYIAKNELFQAKATLRSIIQHSKDLKVQTKAQERLSDIEQGSAADSTEIKDQ